MTIYKKFRMHYREFMTNQKKIILLLFVGLNTLTCLLIYMGVNKISDPIADFITILLFIQVITAILLVINEPWKQ